MRILEIFGAYNDTRQDAHKLAALPTVLPNLALRTAIFILSHCSVNDYSIKIHRSLHSRHIKVTNF